MNSANSTLIKHHTTEKVTEKLSLHKKIKITADTDRTVEHTSTALYSEIYFQKALKSLFE